MTLSSSATSMAIALGLSLLGLGGHAHAHPAPRFKAVAFDISSFDANSVVPEVETAFPGRRGVHEDLARQAVRTRLFAHDHRPLRRLRRRDGRRAGLQRRVAMHLELRRDDLADPAQTPTSTCAARCSRRLAMPRAGPASSRFAPEVGMRRRWRSRGIADSFDGCSAPKEPDTGGDQPPEHGSDG